MRVYAALYDKHEEYSFVIYQDIADGDEWYVYCHVRTIEDAKEIAAALNERQYRMS